MEVRFSPIKWGFYLATGAIYSGEEVDSSYEKRNRLIGSNFYNTAIDLTVTRIPAFGTAWGLGFVHVFDSGFSAGVETLWSQTKPTLEIEMTTPDATLTFADKSILESETEDIKAERSFNLAYLAIGYNS